MSDLAQRAVLAIVRRDGCDLYLYRDLVAGERVTCGGGINLREDEYLLCVVKEAGSERVVSPERVVSE